MHNCLIFKHLAQNPENNFLRSIIYLIINHLQNQKTRRKTDKNFFIQIILPKFAQNNRNICYEEITLVRASAATGSTIDVFHMVFAW